MSGLGLAGHQRGFMAFAVAFNRPLLGTLSIHEERERQPRLNLTLTLFHHALTALMLALMPPVLAYPIKVVHGVTYGSAFQGEVKTTR